MLSTGVVAFDGPAHSTCLQGNFSARLPKNVLPHRGLNDPLPVQILAGGSLQPVCPRERLLRVLLMSHELMFVAQRTGSARCPKCLMTCTLRTEQGRLCKLPIDRISVSFRGDRSMSHETDAEKVARFELALKQLTERFSEDRYVLAAVLVGRLSEETIWRRESLRLWIIEADGVSRRLRSDGSDERISRILVENGINIHAEVIPRSRFRQMVEGSSRTAFSCNFFATRKLVYSNDPSIDNWFEQASTVAVKDKERELLIFSTWTIHALRHARKLLEIRRDVELAGLEVLNVAQSVACTEIIRSGQVWEQEAIYRGIELAPDLFQILYLNVLARRKNARVLATALDAADRYLDQHYTEHLKPLLGYLKAQNRVVPLSEISDHFAWSQIYPWHLESACEWLEHKGRLEKLSTPFKLTSRSREMLEEPAYYLETDNANDDRNSGSPREQSQEHQP